MRPPQTSIAESTTILGHVGLYLVFVFTALACLVAYGCGAIFLFVWLSFGHLVVAQLLWIFFWLMLLLFGWSFATLRRRCLLAASCALCAYAGLLLLAVGHWHNEGVIREVTRRLPPVLQDSEVMEISETDDCLAVIFRMTEIGLGQLRVGGMQAATATGFSPWHETPMQEPGGSLHRAWKNGSGLFCAALEPSLKATILAAMNRPGSYYATRGRAAVIVMPQLGWVVYSFDDD